MPLPSPTKISATKAPSAVQAGGAMLACRTYPSAPWRSCARSSRSTPMLIADTGPLVTMLNARDKHRETCTQCNSRYSPGQQSTWPLRPSPHAGRAPGFAHSYSRYVPTLEVVAMATFTAREFNQDVSAAKRAADKGPVVITDRGGPAYVLLSISDYNGMLDKRSIVDRLEMDDDLDFV